jgi:phosphotransferase system enzyme I (PtsP)
MKKLGESLGLRTLEDINNLILHSHNLQETLDNIVNLVAKRMNSDVCSLYLLDDDGRTLRLQATRGLSKRSIGKVTMQTSEGLTGLVIETCNMVSTSNAPHHPRYKYFKETKEEKFRSFLGIPLMDRQTPIGVIIVQTRESRRFKRSETTTLATIAWQITSIILNAKLLESVRKKEEERASLEKELTRLQASTSKPHTKRKTEAKEQQQDKIPYRFVGTAGSPGFALGKIYILNRSWPQLIEGLEKSGSVREEQEKLTIALEQARIQTIYLEKRIAQSLSKEDAAIFHTHLMILEDRGFTQKIANRIDEGTTAARAVYEVTESYVEAFSGMEDPYLRERSADMKDIGRRILECLGDKSAKRPQLREKLIIVADDILPSDLAALDHSKILGILTERGDVNSHAAIMARSLGIPAILGVGQLLEKIDSESNVIIDGNSGHVFVNPEDGIRVEYERLKRDYSQQRKKLEKLRDLPAKTTDGWQITLRANIGMLSDIKMAHANGAEGVGLYRTEFPYMARNSFPATNEQYRLYRKILESFPKQPVTIRTLDIGGDKGLPYFSYPKEDNPFMGWRSIRVSLDRQDIFRDQLAAILMAAPFGSPRLLLPMVSSTEEIHAVKYILSEIIREMSGTSKIVDCTIPFGIMIEIPAAVQTIDALLPHVDFVSIGSNDLIQYTLAADRNNPLVSKYYDPCHPAVIGSIHHVAKAAQKAGKQVSLCGEMASVPIIAILLMGLGISELSIAAPSIPQVKLALRKTSLQHAKKLARTILRCESSYEIKACLRDESKRLGISIDGIIVGQQQQKSEELP